ncbi:TetR family transcriptional regulator (plasmid) [Deinococcus aetherius]|uniref:TetR family transcriptional regulator n=1 Tax=Deinococcus aetherius TaxID=200252 RepID=A0ABM8ALF6_9DEIO|nr:TetR/AcrR family transcriptional regulator [Deinococcus aetherius]BDP44648.1 TetR family transcriptional regulator [Deinococcus aetherius]
MTSKDAVQPRRRPRQVRSRRRVAKILDAALHVFAERGYGATTTTAIAEQAGVSVGSLYQFFPNKEAVLYALSERFDASFFTWLDEALAGSEGHRSTVEWIDALFDALVEMDQQHPGLFRVLAHAYTSPEFARAERHFNQQVARRVVTLLTPLAPHLAAGQLEVVATVCVEVTHALFHLASTDEVAADDVLPEARRLLGAYLSSVTGAPPLRPGAVT